MVIWDGQEVMWDGQEVVWDGQGVIWDRKRHYITDNVDIHLLPDMRE